MSYEIYLKVVDPEETDSTLVPDALPIFKGDEDESLACGNCKEVIARGVSTKTFYERLSADHRLVVRCPCGAHNVIPSETGVR
jgi:hypothetical protein